MIGRHAFPSSHDEPSLDFFFLPALILRLRVFVLKPARKIVASFISFVAISVLDLQFAIWSLVLKL